MVVIKDVGCMRCWSTQAQSLRLMLDF